MKVMLSPDVQYPARDVRRSALFQNWKQRVQAMNVGVVLVTAVFAWGGEVKILQMSVEFGGQMHPVLLRGATVDMLTVLVGNGAHYIVHIDQPRVAVGQVVRSNPSGMVDGGEPPATAAVRELGEEVGADIHWNRPIPLYPCPLLVSPGGTDEVVSFYVVHGAISPKDLQSLYGRITGLRDEGERIQLQPCRIDAHQNIDPALRSLHQVLGLPDLKAVTSLLLYERFLRQQ
jgi:8-oxo-dGTP pyrophosphatase MutT (NUDIX family)